MKKISSRVNTNVKLIDCEENPAEKLEIFTQMKEPQLFHYYEPDPGIFIAESVQVIQMALDAGYEPMAFLLWKEKAEEILLAIQSEHLRSILSDCTVYLADRKQLGALAGCELTGGILAAFRRKKLPSVCEILQDATRVVVLEEVMNPRNVGSIFRSAAAIGFDAVLLTKGCSDPLYRRCARVSMGTVFQIRWTFVDDLYFLKENGFVSVAMALTENGIPMDDPALKHHPRLAVLMGSERNGLKPETMRMCDYTARIPMKNGVDSLNVAAASAIALWELRK